MIMSFQILYIPCELSSPAHMERCVRIPWGDDDRVRLFLLYHQHEFAFMAACGFLTADIHNYSPTLETPTQEYG